MVRACWNAGGIEEAADGESPADGEAHPGDKGCEDGQTGFGRHTETAAGLFTALYHCIASTKLLAAPSRLWQHGCALLIVAQCN